MLTVPMGSELAGTISAAEAARILKVDVRTIRRMTRQGLLPALLEDAPKGKKRPRYILRDVIAASKARDLPGESAELANIATRALALAESCQHTINQIYAFLGIDQPALGVTEQEVLELYEKARKKLELLAFECPAEEIRFWAKVFLAMNEEYLRTASHHTGDDDVWEVYLVLAQKLGEKAPRHLFRFHKELEVSYGYLEAGRRNLRAASYFYVREKEGYNVAARLFPDGRTSLDDGVLAALLSH